MAAKLLKSGTAVAVLLATVFVFVDPAFAAGGTVKDPGVMYAATNENITFTGDDDYTGESRVLDVVGGAKPDACNHGDEPDDGVIGTPPNGEPSGACFTVQVTLNGGASNGNMTLTNASGGGHPSGVEILGATVLPNPVFNFFGTRDEVNAALKTLTFNPESDYETSYPDAGDPTFVNLDIKDGNGDDVVFVDEGGDPVNGGDVVLDLRIEQANDGPTLEIEALNQPIEVPAGGDVTLTNTDGTPDFQDDVFVTDPDLDDDEIDDVMLMVAWLDGGGGQADFSLSPSVSPSCVSSLEEIMLQDDDIDVGEPLEDRCDVLPGPIDISLVPADIPGSLSFTSSTQDQQAIAALARYNGLDDQEDVIEDIFSYIEFDAMPTGDCDCTITVVISDLGNNGLPLLNLVPGVVLPDPGFAIETIDFKVRDAENDPPVVTAVPAGPTPVDELASMPVAFTVEDPDAEGDLTITGITTVGGTLSGAPAVGTNGSPAVLTAALSGMTFDANETTADPGLGSVTVSVEDNGWGAAEDPSDSESASATATFTIEEDGFPDADPNPDENDPPVLTTPASLYAIEGVTTPFLPATIGVTDPDAAGDDLTMTITPVGGTTSDDGVTTGTVAELDALLDGLTFTATQDADFDDAVGTITIDVSDNGHNPDLDDPADVGTDSAVIDITIEDDELPPEVNDPPVLTAPASIAAVEGVAFGFDPASIGVTDPDAGTDDLTLTITSGAGGSTNREGVHTGSLAELNTLLDGLAYTPQQDADATDGATSIVIDVNDDGHNPDSADPADEGTDSATISVAVDDDEVELPDVNDPPVITLPATGTVVEGVPAGFDSATIGVDDPDAGTDDLTMTITSVGGTTDDDGATTGTLVELNAILDGLEFTASDDADFDDEVGSITIVVNDNGHNPDSNLPADEGVDSAVIDLIIDDDDEAPPDVNDPPVLTAPGSVLAVEGVVLALDPSAIGVTDPDAGADDLTMTITSSGEGTTNEEGAHTGSLAELNAILDGLEFTPDQDADAVDDVASILIEVNDNGHNPDTDDPVEEGTDAATIAVAVDDDEAPPEPNDAPTLAVPGAQSVVVGGAVIFTGALRITVDDPDAGAGDLTLHIEVTGGALAPATADVTGTLAELQAHLDSLVFTAGAVPGAGSISITVDDLGNTGTGGPLTASASVDLTITAAPDDPDDPDDPVDPSDTTSTTTTTTVSTTTSTAPGAPSTTDPAAVADNRAVASSGTSSGTLPRTGASLFVALTAALALAALGSVLVVGARRRRR